MKIGSYTVSQIVSHHLGLDGGAMFGVVPKTLWERSISADDRNRIPMLTRLLLLESTERRILIDLGCGDKFSEKMRDIYALETKTDVALHEHIGQLTHVVITHLHFDHVGGVSYRDEQGLLALSFPEAEHIVSRTHWDYAQQPNVREKASFYPENLEPLSTASLSLVAAGEEILPGIRVWESSGHTKGMMWVEIFDEKNTLVFPTDVVPTSHHLPLPYIMGYDMCAETMIAEKEQFLRQAIENDWILCFEHDREVCAAKITSDEKGRAIIAEEIEIPEFKGR